LSADFYHIAESNMPEKPEKIDTIFLKNNSAPVTRQRRHS